MDIKKLAFRTKMKWWADYNNKDGECLHYYMLYLTGKFDTGWTLIKMFF